MPLYTYACTDHGEFTAWGRLATSDAPEACPTCARLAPRALARPNVSTGGDVQASGTAERPAPTPHMCGAGCMH